MAFNVRETGCCGVLELVDISKLQTPLDVIRETKAQLPGYIGTNLTYHLKPYIYFTGVINRRLPDHASSRDDNYGEALADFIRANDLGEVFDQIPVKNNWTGNPIQMWIWMPNYTTLRIFGTEPDVVAI